MINTIQYGDNFTYFPLLHSSTGIKFVNIQLIEHQPE